MRSFAQRSFWDAYHELPDRIKLQARHAYTLFQQNPDHPSLNFKPVGRRNSVYSVRISAQYRALGVMHQNDIVWFWIGPHHEYDRLLQRR